MVSPGHGNAARNGSRPTMGGRAVLAAAAILFATGCNRGILDPVGPVGHAEKLILINSTAIMLAIVIPVIIATLAVAWWFRRGNTKATYRPDWEYSGAVEMVVWSVPALTIMLLGGITWIGSHQLDPRRPLESPHPAVNVEVISLDWKWLFIYPDQGIATVNRLVVPAGTPVRFRLTSANVWNSFFVPQMGTMIYTMPGMTTELNLQADRQGVFEGLSSHFSGEGFPGMSFRVHSIPREQFAAWAQGARGSGPLLDGRSYAELARPSSHVPPFTFGSVAPGLFDAVATRRPLPMPAAQPAQPVPAGGPTAVAP